MDTTEIIILAAGKGTRMGSLLPKCLVPVKNIPMIDRLLSNIQETLTNKALLVIGHKAEALQNHLGGSVRYVLQEEQKGTAHAAQIALSALLPTTTKVIILYSDHPFYTSKTVQSLLEALEKNPVVLATVDAGDFSDWRSLFTHWGRIVKNEKGEVDKIVEYKDADPDTRKISIVNPALYAFDVTTLTEALKKVQTNNVQGEYYLTDVVRIVREEGKSIGEVRVDAKEALGINSKAELEYAESLI